MSEELHRRLIAKIRRHGYVLARYTPPLLRSDVFYLLRVAAMHNLVDEWQPSGTYMDRTLIDRAEQEWEGLLLDAVPNLVIGALPADIKRMMDEAQAAGRDHARSFVLELNERTYDWLDGVRQDVRQLLDEPWTREDRESDRARALRAAHHYLMAEVPGYHRLIATDKEQDNTREALEREGRRDKNDIDENELTGLTLTWMDLHRATALQGNFMLKDGAGQWRTTVESVRDALRKPDTASSHVEAPPQRMWPSRRGNQKGRTLSLDIKNEQGETLAGQIPAREDGETELMRALQALRDLLDGQLDKHPLLKDVARRAESSSRAGFQLEAAKSLPVLLDLLESHRDEETLQAAIVYEWGRGGRGKSKGWGAEEVAASYGLSKHAVYREVEFARRLLRRRGLGRAD